MAVWHGKFDNFFLFQKNEVIEREVEEELEKDTVQEYIMMSDDEGDNDSDIVGTEAEVNVKSLYTAVIDWLIYSEVTYWHFIICGGNTASCHGS